VTVAPDSLVTRVLDVVRGDAPVGRSLAEARTLETLRAAEGLSPHFLGYVDWRQAAALLTDEKRPFGRELIAAVGAPPPAPSCRGELDGLAALMPRWTFGATALGPRRTGGQMTVELRADAARELQALGAPVPGVGAPLGEAVMSMGLAGDVGKGIALLRRVAGAVTRAPYRCRELSFLNEAAAELSRELSAPIPSWVPELRGLVLVLDSVQGGVAMPDVKAYGVLAASDPIQLIDMAKRAMSQLAGVNIPPDGRPVPIPGGVLPLMSGHVAMKGQLLGVSLGGGSELKLVRLMSSTPQGGVPLLSFAVDGAKLAAVAKLLGKLFGDGREEPFGRGRSHVAVEATERGLVLRADQVTEAAARPTP
jgi:hypothetical protein